MKKLFSLILVILVLGLAGNAQAAIINVPHDMTLQAALDIAETNNEDDIINIDAGIYTTAVTFTYNANVNRALSIVGAGSGVTVLSGNNSTRVLDLRTDGLANDSNADINVQGLTIRHGSSGPYSGGLYVATKDADVRLDDCFFFHNDGATSALYIQASSSGAIAVSNSSFTENEGTAPGDTGAATLVSDTGAISITGSSFIQNHGDNIGGGANAGSNTGNVVVANNTFERNTASMGAGVFAGSNSGNVTVSNNTFAENEGNWGGGAYVQTDSGNLTITNNTFIKNAAEQRGGAACIDFGSFGGQPGTGTADIINNTIYDNEVDPGTDGGGLYLELYDNTLTANIYNNIIWANREPGAASDDIYVNDDVNNDGTGAQVNLRNNDYNTFYIRDGDHRSTNANISDDPLWQDPVVGDFHLQAGSPCVDAGQNGAPGIPPTDFEGDSRTIDGNGDGSSVADMGADEYNPGAPVAPAGGGGGGGGGGGCFIGTVASDK